jgi:phytoene/squalene synthetase
MAVKLLSPRIQKDIYAIYGFVRLADEIVDSFHKYEKEALLDELDQSIYRSIEMGISINPIINAFQEVVNRNNIDRSLIEAFMASMRADLYKTHYTTSEEINNYIYGSADVVGLMCLKVFVYGDHEEYNRLKPYAMRLGSAFQKVNFLRDLKQDSDGLNRNYFPHLTGKDLSNDLKEEIINEIEMDFDVAYEGIKQLPLNARMGVFMAYRFYQKLLNKLKRTPASKIKEKRIRVNTVSKFQLLFTSFLRFKLNLL